MKYYFFYDSPYLKDLKATVIAGYEVVWGIQIPIQ